SKPGVKVTSLIFTGSRKVMLSTAPSMPWLRPHTQAFESSVEKANFACVLGDAQLPAEVVLIRSLMTAGPLEVSGAGAGASAAPVPEPPEGGREASFASPPPPLVAMISTMISTITPPAISSARLRPERPVNQDLTLPPKPLAVPIADDAAEGRSGAATLLTASIRGAAFSSASGITGCWGA